MCYHCPAHSSEAFSTKPTDFQSEPSTTQIRFVQKLGFSLRSGWLLVGVRACMCICVGVSALISYILFLL